MCVRETPWKRPSHFMSVSGEIKWNKGEGNPSLEHKISGRLYIYARLLKVTYMYTDTSVSHQDLKYNQIPLYKGYTSHV